MKNFLILLFLTFSLSSFAQYEIDTSRIEVNGDSVTFTQDTLDTYFIYKELPKIKPNGDTVWFYRGLFVKVVAGSEQIISDSKTVRKKEYLDWLNTAIDWSKTSVRDEGKKLVSLGKRYITDLQAEKDRVKDR